MVTEMSASLLIKYKMEEKIQVSVRQIYHLGGSSPRQPCPSLTRSFSVAYFILPNSVLFLLFILLQLFSCSVMCDSLRPRGLQHARLPCPSPSHKLGQLMSTELVKPSNHLILCCPLLLLPSIFPSIRVFSNELALLIRWPKYGASIL